MSFLDETEYTLESRGKTWDDVKLIYGSYTNTLLTIEQFKQLADVDYDGGYGAQEMPCDLVIAGDGWKLVREEYDGSESWGFVSFEHPTKFKKVKIDPDMRFLSGDTEQDDQLGKYNTCWECLDTHIKESRRYYKKQRLKEQINDVEVHSSPAE